MNWYLTAEALIVVALVAATRNDHSFRYALKPIASVIFVVVGLTEATAGDRPFVIGLIFGAVGDIALMGRGPKPFMVGLLAFLCGHLAYVIGFVQTGGQGRTAVGVLIGIVLAVASLIWLLPAVVGMFRAAVPAYICVVSIMLAAGIASERSITALGAALFAASDLFVARQAFKDSSPLNPTLGLPLYYLGQVIIAFSLGP